MFIVSSCSDYDYDRKDNINYIEIKSIVGLLLNLDIGKETVELAPKCIVEEKSKIEEIHRLILNLEESNTSFDPPDVYLRAKLKLENGKTAFLDHNTRQIMIAGRVYSNNNELIELLSCGAPILKTK